MNSRFQRPPNDGQHDDDTPHAQDEEVDLRYRAYQHEQDKDEDEDDYYSDPPHRVADGWATETKSESPWWVKGGIAIVSILIVLGLVAGLAGPFLGSFGSNEPARVEYVPAKVIDVLDVRTIMVEIEGEAVTVRYIGVEPLPIDSPWYDIGILANQQLVANAEVLLEADEIDTDDFGRLLRYVYVERNFVNGLLLRNGIALPSEQQDGLDRHYPNLKGWSEAAQLEKLGYWSGMSPEFTSNAPSASLSPELLGGIGEDYHVYTAYLRSEGIN